MEAFPEATDRGQIEVVRAPGRANLSGEHTDYNQGLVLPVAINLEVRVALRRRPDRRVRLASLASGEVAELDLDRIRPPRGGWIDYVAGTAREMAAAGLAIGGIDGVIGSTIPVASGLSSSAALELASAWSLSGPAGPPTDALTLARIAQRAENTYVGVMCGLMDQSLSTKWGVGGDEGTRTPDPRDANAVLFQLSYIPTERASRAFQALGDRSQDSTGILGISPAG